MADQEENEEDQYGVIQDFEGGCDVRQLTHEVADIELYVDMGQNAGLCGDSSNALYAVCTLLKTNKRRTAKCTASCRIWPTYFFTMIFAQQSLNQAAKAHTSSLTRLHVPGVLPVNWQTDKQAHLMHI